MNRKTYHLIALAALLFAGAAITACSTSSDNEITEEEPSQSANATDTLIIKIKASKSPYATTRGSFSSDGNTLISMWSYYENVTLLKLISEQMGRQEYWQVVGEVTTEDISDDGLTCLFKGEFKAGTLNVGDYLRIVELGKITSHSSFVLDYTGQDGSLNTIACKYDYWSTPEQKKKAIRVTAIEGNNIIASDATFASHQAIVHFTILDESGQEIFPSSLTISAKNAYGQEQIVTEEVITGVGIESMGSLQLQSIPPVDGVYVAMRGFRNANLSLSTQYNGVNYTYTESNVTFENGKYYDMTVKMEQ